MRTSVVAFLFVGCACGASAPSAPRPAARVEGWPPIPFAPSSLGLRTLIDIHETLRPLPSPEGPRWARSVHGPWVDERAEALALANEARRWLRAGSPQELAVGAAIHGDIAARTAAQLEDVDLRALPPAAAAAVRAPIADLRQRAYDAWTVCVEYAAGPELDAWRRACEVRRRALNVTRPAAPGDRSPRSPPRGPPPGTAPGG